MESNRAVKWVTNLESGILLDYCELVIEKPCKHITELANNLHRNEYSLNHVILRKRKHTHTIYIADDVSDVCKDRL